jgi:Fatty acid desaturase
MKSDFERYIAVSARVDTSDINWDEARDAGLTDDEVFVLTYFSDVENQTIRYMKMLLGMRIAFQPDVAAFLATWNYEEFFHGYELARLMQVCGRTVEDRREYNYQRLRFNELLENLFVPMLSRVFAVEFPAVYLSFGAIQEMTTLRAYEHLHDYTRNPVLQTLCDRIARQERRHFAWYFNHARELLDAHPAARTLTRRLMKFNWAPVGAGFHTPAEVKRLFTTIFYPIENARTLCREIDGKIGTLPGLEGIQLMEPFFRRAGAI